MKHSLTYCILFFALGVGTCLYSGTIGEKACMKTARAEIQIELIKQHLRFDILAKNTDFKTVMESDSEYRKALKETTNNR